MLSALTAFVIPPVLAKRMDIVLMGMLRSMLKGKACTTKDGKKEKWSDAKDWRHWGLVPTAVELSVRRICMYQRWAAKPGEFKQVLASVFGDSAIDEMEDKKRITEWGDITVHATPGAKQFRDDMKIVSLTADGQ